MIILFAWVIILFAWVIVLFAWMIILVAWVIICDYFARIYKNYSKFMGNINAVLIINVFDKIE